MENEPGEGEHRGNREADADGLKRPWNIAAGSKPDLPLPSCVTWGKSSNCHAIQCYLTRTMGLKKECLSLMAALGDLLHAASHQTSIRFSF